MKSKTSIAVITFFLIATGLVTFYSCGSSSNNKGGSSDGGSVDISPKIPAIP